MDNSNIFTFYAHFEKLARNLIHKKVPFDFFNLLK
jgi:hypothetical protein